MRARRVGRRAGPAGGRAPRPWRWESAGSLASGGVAGTWWSAAGLDRGGGVKKGGSAVGVDRAWKANRLSDLRKTVRFVQTREGSRGLRKLLTWTLSGQSKVLSWSMRSPGVLLVVDERNTSGLLTCG